ncbi:hypothetical protein GJ496_000457 [Pomphorhynchus laevis]|nr:hypothetical protein GJ496_000457 [Pomphorhynchus laevis]
MKSETCVVMEKRLMKVYFPNGSFHSLRYTDETLVSEIIEIALKGRVNPHPKTYKICYSIRATRLTETVDKLNLYWLNNTFNMTTVRKLLDNTNHWRFELRIRLFPCDINCMLIKDRSTFVFLNEQVLSIS